MKLLTHEQYEKLSPVKKQVYERRVEKYFGTKEYTVEFVYPPDRDYIPVWGEWCSFSGTMFWVSRARIQAVFDAASLLIRDADEVGIENLLDAVTNEVKKGS